MVTKIVDIILFNHDRILLVQQKKSKAYGLWSLPGGHIEENESPELAIMREVTEELGVTLSGLDKAKRIEHTEGKTDEGKLTVVTFVKPLVSKEVTLQADELIGFGWFTHQEIEKISASLRSPWIIEMVQEIIFLKA